MSGAGAVPAPGAGGTGHPARAAPGTQGHGAGRAVSPLIPSPGQARPLKRTGGTGRGRTRSQVTRGHQVRAAAPGTARKRRGGSCRRRGGHRCRAPSAAARGRSPPRRHVRTARCPRAASLSPAARQCHPENGKPCRDNAAPLPDSVSSPGASQQNGQGMPEQQPQARRSSAPAASTPGAGHGCTAPGPSSRPGGTSGSCPPAAGAASPSPP